MARVPKVEPFDPPPAVGAVPGRDTTPVHDTGDRELVRRAQREGKEAIEELVRRHQHRVFAVAGGILRRREDVEDIAQQYPSGRGKHAVLMPPDKLLESLL